MKKPLLLALGLATAALVTFFASEFILGSAIKTGVNTLGPRLTQTQLELRSARLSVLGTGTLAGLTVGNPAGWSDHPAFYLGRVHFDIAPASLLDDVIVINHLVIEQPEFSYETHLVSSNIGDLLRNIEASAGSKDATPKPASPAAKPKKFIVKHFKLEGGKVSVGVGPAALPLPLPPIELDDLGVREGGLTAGQLSVALLGGVVPTILKTTTGAAAKLGGTMGATAGESLKRLFGGKK